MSKANKKVTMQDVAEKAGVSYQTVSRVLNNSCNVSESTKAKIQKAIADLQYVPNVLAQHLGHNDRKAIGLISLATNLQAPNDLAGQVRKYAMEQDHQIVIMLVGSNNAADIQEALNDLKSQLVEKIIINVPMDSMDAINITKNNSESKLLFVDVDPYCPVFNVTFNPADGTLFSVSHLQQLGHKKVALLAGPEGSVSADLRLKCWRDGLRINNIEEVCIETGDWSAQSGYYATLKILRDHRDFTALLVANDQMAMGAISALAQNNILVPDDVSVIGYDDYADSAYYQPPLTSIHLDRDLQCKIAVTKLLGSTEDQVSAILPTTLVLRSSTAPVTKKRDNIRHMAEILRQAAGIIEKSAPE